MEKIHQRIIAIGATLIGGVSLLGVSGQPAWAQADVSANEFEEIEQIVVVAQRRETLLQDTPITMSTFTGNFMETAGIQDFRDLASITPGLYLGGYAMLGSFPISIRGIGSSVGGIGADDPISVYVDGVYVGRPSGFVFQFAGVERIEVLRGPQGTLYGRNATGGAINVISRAPSETFTSRAAVEYGWGSFEGGDFDRIRTEIGMSGPISDKAGYQFAAVYQDMDGFQRNLFDGRKVNGEIDVGFRGSLWFRPKESLSVKLNVDYASDEDPDAFKDVGSGPGNPNTVNLNEPTRSTRKPRGIGAVVSYELGSVTLESITGYRRDEADILSDSDLLPISVTPLLMIEKQNQFTQELRLISDESRVVWSLGAYYLDEDAEQDLFVDIVPIDSSLHIDDELAVESYAVYGQATYAVTDQLNLTAGVRYSDEKKSFTIAQFGTGLFPEVLLPPTRLSQSWDAWTPKLGIDYKIDENAMLYATVSRGFKSGGFNFTSTQSPFDPEFVWAYEIGLKSDSFENRLRFNLAAFVYDYTDLQVRVPATITSVSIENAAAADVWGVEAEFIARPASRLQIEGAIAYLDTKYTEFFIPAAFDPITGAPAVDAQGNPILSDLSGNKLNRSPEWQISAAVQYSWPLGAWGSATLRGNYEHQDGVFFTQDNDPIFSNDGWNNVGIRLLFDSADTQWQFALFAENLTDERYVSNVVDVNPGAGGFVNLPRRFGVRFSYHHN